MIEKIESALRQAFLTAIPAAAGITAFENQNFNPQGLEKWYIFSFMPNLPSVATLGGGGSDAIDGIAQIDINIPSGSGKTGIDSDVSALRSHFTAGAAFSYDSQQVKITNCGRSGGGRKVDAFHRFTVSVSWEARLTR